ncbi:hypothetical protein B9G69_004070 [Bdellovibrio sp. SKB1291214]|uniref:hypothetical protein n=1 Tax=Bdellovibrio sp. SKB1291214 TaxID=1732569 RepID=UPI00223FF674|nr:hypothetical protein [Bdellovibrio sp. SKB1291214]UYL09750.1 hypothetical protein B9G69_004070 [Bdellovibrio sp. SKB1291214]
MIKRLGILQYITTAMLVWSSAFAQIPDELSEVILTGNLNGRSSADFSQSARNIKTTITAGSKGTVIETRKMRTPGSFGVKIRLTSVGKGKTKAKVGDEVWVYYNRKNPWMRFRDAQDAEVQDPTEALKAEARSKGEGIPAQPEENSKSIDPNEAMPNTDRTQTEAGTGGNCTLTNSCGKNNPADLRDIADKIKDDQAAKEKSETAKAKKVVDELTQKKPEQVVSAEAKQDTPPFDKYKKRNYTMTENEWKNFPEVMKYSESKKVAKTIKSAMANREPSFTSYCYRYVKRALVSGQNISYPPGEHAKQAVADLKRQGFKNLMDAPYKGIIKSADDAPKGAIVVYATSDKSQSGDIQIKMDWGNDGGYVSDFYNPRSFLESPKARDFARRGKPYRIIGVMIKP